MPIWAKIKATRSGEWQRSTPPARRAIIVSLPAPTFPKPATDDTPNRVGATRNAARRFQITLFSGLSGGAVATHCATRRNMYSAFLLVAVLPTTSARRAGLRPD